MIMVWSKGRLGNQLFQLSGAESARDKRELMMLFGFSDIPKKFLPANSCRITRNFVFTKNNLRFLEREARQWALKGLLRPLRLASAGFQTGPGVLPVKIFLEDWFSSSLVINMTLTPVAQKLMRAAQESKGQLVKKYPGLVGRELCFVHVRRGDFVVVPKGAPFALPSEWFLKQMKLVREMNPGVIFIFFSDDPDYLESRFSTKNHFQIERGSAFDELLWMAGCDHGILSPSTFSWWAAKTAAAGGGDFIAPAGWTNWRSGRLANEEMPASFLNYRPVD